MPHPDIDAIILPNHLVGIEYLLRDGFISSNSPRQIVVRQGSSPATEMSWQGERIVSARITSLADIDFEITRLIRQANEACAKIILFSSSPAAEQALASRLASLEIVDIESDGDFARIIATKGKGRH